MVKKKAIFLNALAESMDFILLHYADSMEQKRRFKKASTYLREYFNSISNITFEANV